MANNVLIGTNATWTTAANWSSGAAPVTGDVVFLTSNATTLNAGLSNSAVLLTTMNLVMDFTGQVGINGTTNTYLQIGATTAYLGLPPTGGQSSNGPSVFNWNAGTASATINIVNSSVAASAPGQSPIKLLGSALTINVTGGNVSIAALATENATVNTFSMLNSGQGNAPQAYFGPGCNMKTLTLEGGYANSASQQLTNSAQVANNGSQLLYQGSGGFGTLTVDAGGRVTYNGSGSVNSLALTGLIDLSGGGSPITFGNVTLYAGAVFYDPLGRSVFTNSPTVVNCTRAQVSVNLGLARYI